MRGGGWMWRGAAGGGRGEPGAIDAPWARRCCGGMHLRGGRVAMHFLGGDRMVAVWRQPGDGVAAAVVHDAEEGMG